MSIEVALEGRLGKPPHAKTSAAGKPWISFSLATSGRGEGVERVNGGSLRSGCRGTAERPRRGRAALRGGEAFGLAQEWPCGPKADALRGRRSSRGAQEGGRACQRLTGPCGCLGRF